MSEERATDIDDSFKRLKDKEPEEALTADQINY